MSMIESVKTVLSKYVDFSGRARRSEFWWYMLCYCILSSVLSGIYQATQSNIVAVISGIVSLGLLLPTLAVHVRRLHDVGRSGWWLLLDLTCIGGIVILIWEIMDSQPGDNQYGPNPKGM